MENSETKKITVSTGFTRKVAIGYQSWDFPIYYTEEVEVKERGEVDVIRKQLYLHAKAAVYEWILNSYQSMYTGIQQNSKTHGDFEALKNECLKALEDVAKELEALRVGK